MTLQSSLYFIKLIVNADAGSRRLLLQTRLSNNASCWTQALIIECLDGQLSVKSLSLRAVINSFSLVTGQRSWSCAMHLYLAWVAVGQLLKRSTFSKFWVVLEGEKGFKISYEIEKDAIPFSGGIRALALPSLIAILFLALVMAHWSDFTWMPSQ